MSGRLKKGDKMKLSFKVVGWVNTDNRLCCSHTTEEKGKDITVFCDICPICGHPAGNESDATFCGCGYDVVETHASQYHGHLPQITKQVPEKIEERVKDVFYALSKRNMQ